MNYSNQLTSELAIILAVSIVRYLRIRRESRYDSSTIYVPVQHGYQMLIHYQKLPYMFRAEFYDSELK